jgi:hypothetical protein
MSMSFNLCSYAFIDFVITDIKTFLEGKVNAQILENAFKTLQRHLPHATVHAVIERNSRANLARYNRRVVEQCRERVYCSSKEEPVLA